MTTVLLSAAGAPGAARLIRALQQNGEREVRVVGTDMSAQAIGAHLCDAFHVVPAGCAIPLPCHVSDPGSPGFGVVQNRQSSLPVAML